MSKTNPFQSNCPIARVTHLLGDGWTLLVIREAFLGTRTFNEFERELGIARNILSARLKTLVKAGVLARRVSEVDRRVVEYRLTQPGLDLLPVLVSLAQWAGRHLCCESVPMRFVERASGADIPPVAVRSATGEVLGPSAIAMVAGPQADDQLKSRLDRAVSTSVRPA